MADFEALLRGIADPSLPLRTIAVLGDLAALAGCRFLTCIPARDEGERIAGCLQSLDAELTPADGAILLANGCSDDTVARARNAFAIWTRPWAIVEIDWIPGAGSAPLARRLAFDLASHFSPDGLILSIDGDTEVLPGLRAAYEDEFAKGYDLVCGGIGFLPDEAARLPPADPASEAIISAYRTASREILALLCPDLDNPWPHHGNIGGANFAMRSRAYRAAGPLPTPPSGEDRALRRRFEARGLRIRYSDGPRVETSCRLDGRAGGGLSEELRRNRTETDPIVDELLEPPETLLLRCRSRTAFRAAADATERAAILSALGLDEAVCLALAAEGGEAGWQSAEDISSRLRRTRLRLSDLKRELPSLLEGLASIRAVRSGSPPSGER